MYCATIDVEKAFDSVERVEMIKCLSEIGLETTLIKLIAKIYEKDIGVIILNNKIIGTIRKTRGIKQGCKMSPILFNLLMNYIIKKLNLVYKNNTNSMNFADDGLILADIVQRN